VGRSPGDLASELELSFLNDIDFVDFVPLTKEVESPLDLDLLEEVAELEYRSVRPIAEARDAHHEVKHAFKPLALDLGERAVEICFIKGGKVTILEASHSCSPGLIGQESKLSEGLSCTHRCHISHQRGLQCSLETLILL